MDLALGLVVPSTGACADVVVHAPDGTCLAEVTPELLARVLPSGESGRLWARGAEVAPDALLGAAPLVRGARIEVGQAPSGASGDEPVRVLHVVGGPEAGRVVGLPAGTTTLGRGSGADVSLDDARVSRSHCRLEVTAGGVVVEDTGSANGTTVDAGAVPAGGTDLRPGAVLRVGCSRLTLCTSGSTAVPVAPTGDGRLSFNRPPRLRASFAPVQVVVPAPPVPPERSPLPVLAVLAPLALGVVMWRLIGSTTFLLFTLLTPVLAVGGIVSERRRGRRLSRRDRALWRAQRDVAEATLAAAVAADEQRRRADAPDPVEALATASGPGPRLWERRRGDDDFLQLRLGLADLAATVEAEGDLDGLRTTARDVPVVLSLPALGVLGLAGPRTERLGVGRWLVAQAATWHSPRDLCVVVLAERAEDWHWAGWLPHCRPSGEDCRALLGLTPAQRVARLRELTALVATREGERRAGAGAGAGRPGRAVLLVVDGARALRDLPGLDGLLSDGPALGVYAICLDADERLLPDQCAAVALLGPGGDLRVRQEGQQGQQGPSTAVADQLSDRRTVGAARDLAPLRDDRPRGDGAASLPLTARWSDAVSLVLDGSTEDAERVLARWAEQPRSTEVVLGAGPDGVLSVDLSGDGPHALVAGTTGSGKSELLQSLLASLALVNRPDELTFVLVDYKGGAAFGPCAGLPHTVGVVTDLDGVLVERALSSLRAELSRREAVLRSCGAKDVEEHRRLVDTRSRSGPRDGLQVLPRLVIVVDEFAALAEEIPDFVGGLVGIARRGRSLGVHLVLATQRPEGVVSAEIRANTNLRICLAVTQDGESRDVLDSPVAASISRATPGRGWVRTGHGDLRPFQTGRVGGRRPGPVSRADRPVVELLPAAELGDPLPTRLAGGDEGAGLNDLALFVDACAEASRSLGLPAARSPWLEPLPEAVLRQDLPPVDDPLAGTPGRVPPLAYGLLDVPDEQARQLLALDLDRSSSLLVLGSPRSGRTTALRAVAGAVAATASPDDVHLYALDLGGGGLAALATLPHTGAVVGTDEPERADRLLTWLSDEVARRQRLLAQGGHTDLLGQRSASSPVDRLPHVLLLLDRWESFLAAFQDLDAGRLVELLLALVRQGSAVGVQVVVTADRSGIVGRIGSLVGERLLLRLADRGDYAALGLAARVVPAELPPGRGWSLSGGAPLVAQIALLDADPSGAAQGGALQQLAGEVGSPERQPHRFLLLPTSVRRSALRRLHGPSSLLVGVGGDELQPVEVDLDDTTGMLIAGPAGSGRSGALLTLAAGLVEQGRTVVAVAPRRSPLRSLPGCLTGVPDAAQLLELLAEPSAALLLDDAELLLDSAVAAVVERVLRQARDTGALVLAAGTTDDLLASYRGFPVELRRSGTGLLLSPRSAADGDLLGVRLSRSTGGDVVPGRGLLVVRGRPSPVQVD